MDALAAIELRRSTGRLSEPAPTDAQLTTMLDAASCAPDHGTLRPWRFIVLEGEAKAEFGEVLARAYTERCRAEGVEVVAAKLEKERTKLGRAPMVVIVAALPVSGSIPTIEQVSATAAATQNLLLAATALGLGSMWRTGDPCYDPIVKAALDLPEEALLIGFVYLGTAPDGAPGAERPARSAADHVRHLTSGAPPR
jgi:nitroreductase